jgi:hypothetical protein
MSYLKAGDTISGQEAVAKMTIKNADGTSTIEDMFFGKNLEATCEIEKTDVKTLGKRGTQHKPSGWSGSGRMTVYYVTSLFRKMALRYIKTGIPVYFDIMVTNNDPASSVGPQTVVLKNCSLDSVILTKFDVDSEVLDEDVDFTFDDVDMLDSFVTPTLGSL